MLKKAVIVVLIVVVVLAVLPIPSTWGGLPERAYTCASIQAEDFCLGYVTIQDDKSDRWDQEAPAGRFTLTNMGGNVPLRFDYETSFGWCTFQFNPLLYFCS